MDFVDHIDPADFDLTAPPQTDFYRHVNGTWLDSNPIPAQYPGWGAMLEVHVRNEEILHGLLESAASEGGAEGSPTRMVGDYFAAGMDTDRIEEVGTEPIAGLLELIDAVTDVSSLKTTLLILQRASVGAVHSMSISPDFEDASKYLFYLGQGGLGLPERDYYLRDDDRSSQLRAAYQAHVANQLANLGSPDAEDAAQAIVALETKLAEASLPAEKMRDPSVTMNRHNVVALDELMPSFGLSEYVRALGVEAETINVNNAGFFEALESLLGATPFDTIRSYLRWHVVRRYASSLNSAFEDEAFDFYGRTLGGQLEPRDRWTRVLSAASSDISEQVGKLYVEEAFSETAKQRCEEMVDNLLEAMERSIRNLDWMTEDTKQAALTKLDSFGYKIGYPDRWRDYEGLLVDRSSFAANRLRAAQYEYDRQFGRLGEPVDRDEWAMPPHVVNAYYHPLLNEIVFPAGILQPPFFYEDADDAVIYGAIGSIIGHEITHGFDDSGSKYDAEGRLRNWWTEEDRTEFEERAQVLVEQFNEYEVAEGQTVNGKLTLGENIADLGGLAIAYDAFTSTLEGDEPDIGGYGPRQRFFLSYGTIWRMNYTEPYIRMLANVDTHSPNPSRVNGPLSNFPPFFEEFDVEDGSPMRRAAGHLVRIW